eukprot:TRINITY_DN1934_c0_g1_i2.p1 TRINITY_DN1934_c0_g1~~TRINITY_DN1934_c0_g1_i2.p1  ORF type:complete len:1103 (+),score=235.86 TRINITY_DN1934_c0_g1_i2:78-3386(+)
MNCFYILPDTMSEIESKEPESTLAATEATAEKAEGHANGIESLTAVAQTESNVPDDSAPAAAEAALEKADGEASGDSGPQSWRRSRSRSKSRRRSLPRKGSRSRSRSRKRLQDEINAKMQELQQRRNDNNDRGGWRSQRGDGRRDDGWGRNDQEDKRSDRNRNMDSRNDYEDARGERSWNVNRNNDDEKVAGDDEWRNRDWDRRGDNDRQSWKWRGNEKAPKDACRQFQRRGSCDYGDRCRFSHDSSSCTETPAQNTWNDRMQTADSRTETPAWSSQRQTADSRAETHTPNTWSNQTQSADSRTETPASQTFNNMQAPSALGPSASPLGAYAAQAAPMLLKAFMDTMAVTGTMGMQTLAGMPTMPSPGAQSMPMPGMMSDANGSRSTMPASMLSMLSMPDSSQMTSTPSNSKILPIGNIPEDAQVSSSEKPESARSMQSMPRDTEGPCRPFLGLLASLSRPPEQESKQSSSPLQKPALAVRDEPESSLAARDEPESSLAARDEPESSLAARDEPESSFPSGQLQDNSREGQHTLLSDPQQKTEDSPKHFSDSSHKKLVNVLQAMRQMHDEFDGLLRLGLPAKDLHARIQMWHGVAPVKDTAEAQVETQPEIPAILRYYFTGFQDQSLNTVYTVNNEAVVGGRQTYWTACPDPKFMYFCASRASWQICPLHGPTIPGYPPEDLFQVAVSGGDKGFAMQTEDQTVWQEFVPTMGQWVQSTVTVYVDQGSGFPEELNSFINSGQATSVPGTPAPPGWNPQGPIAEAAPIFAAPGTPVPPGWNTQGPGAASPGTPAAAFNAASQCASPGTPAAAFDASKQLMHAQQVQHPAPEKQKTRSAAAAKGVERSSSSGKGRGKGAIKELPPLPNAEAVAKELAAKEKARVEQRERWEKEVAEQKAKQEKEKMEQAEQAELERLDRASIAIQRRRDALQKKHQEKEVSQTVKSDKHEAEDKQGAEKEPPEGDGEKNNEQTHEGNENQDAQVEEKENQATTPKAEKSEAEAGVAPDDAGQESDEPSEEKPKGKAKAKAKAKGKAKAKAKSGGKQTEDEHASDASEAAPETKRRKSKRKSKNDDSDESSKKGKKKKRRRRRKEASEGEVGEEED